MPLSDAGIEYSVNAVGFFLHMVLGAGLSLTLCYDEQIHNIFDNGGDFSKITFYDEEGKVCAEENGVYMTFEDNCPKGMCEPKIIMQSLATKQSHTGVGNYNWGEVGSVFNMAEWCIYLSNPHSFEMSIDTKTECPIITVISQEKEEIVKLLNKEKPNKGTLKIFKLKDKLTIEKEELEAFSLRSNLDIFINDKPQDKYKDIYNISTLKESKYRKEIKVYGTYSDSKIEWVTPSEEKDKYMEINTSYKRWRGADKMKGGLGIYKLSDFDVCLTLKKTIYPSASGKMPNTPGIIYRFKKGERYVTLKDQNATKGMYAWINDIDQGSLRNGVYKDSELIYEIEILKSDHKSEIFRELCHYPIKGKGGNLENNANIKMIMKYQDIALNKMFNKAFMSDTGKNKEFGNWGNVSYDKNGIWYLAHGKDVKNIISFKEEKVEESEEEKKVEESEEEKKVEESEEEKKIEESEEEEKVEESEEEEKVEESEEEEKVEESEEEGKVEESKEEENVEESEEEEKVEESEEEEKVEESEEEEKVEESEEEEKVEESGSLIKRSHRMLKEDLVNFLTSYLHTIKLTNDSYYIEGDHLSHINGLRKIHRKITNS